MSQPDQHQLDLLAMRRIASVATINPDGGPHLTSVWFLYENGSLYLAIPSSSVKGRNLKRSPQIAVMIDVRRSGGEKGLTAMGEAEIIEGPEAAAIVQRVHEKYLTADGLQDPQVGPVFAAVDDIAVKLVPDKWISWDMARLDAQAFGGAINRNGYLKELEP